MLSNPAWTGTQLAEASTSAHTIYPTGSGLGGDTIIYDWLTYGLPYSGDPNYTAAFTQNISCTGTISVVDTTTGSPGFVTASGTLTTFQESQTGALMKNNVANASSSSSGSANPSITPIVIGEGRAF